MNVRTICLAILFDDEATGYEIRKLSTEGEYSYFIEASYGSIYPALAKLEGEKLVTARIEQQDGKPAKKIYSITPEGRAAFLSELTEPPEEDIYRSEFLLFARFAPHMPRELVAQRIEERQRMVGEKIENLEKMQKDCAAPADCWILDYGLSAMRYNQRYLDDNADKLIALAQDAPAKAAE
ncbi:PadR family transcriptional regulator [Cucumibacter marinus]|uniref:PadR family transcriptional regulator n=1 Tax=Cucumibacter marinus TaxID=1121252 RepID=UPI00048E37DA|nr:PadR family transcriptional regulator [Cucumibacter marinus]